MDSTQRIKQFINNAFPEWTKVNFSDIEEGIDFKENLSELYRIDNDEIILISYTNISITGSDRPKPQLRVFLDEYKKPFDFAKKHQLRYYLFSIFTKDDEMARGLNNFNPKEFIISIETNLDSEGSRRDLRSIYDYANEKIGNRKFLKCSRNDYNADINQASFIYIGTPDNPYKEMFNNFINIFDSRPYLNSSTSSYNLSTSAVSLDDISISNNPYLRALKTKPFLLLAGISGTGKSRKVKELAYMTCPTSSDLADDPTSPGNYCLIEVKPNWHDSTELLGYYSNLSSKYDITPFMKFVYKATRNPNIPFFVCLDEMNLAPVEQYFAEYLSVLETRVLKNGKIESAELLKKELFENYPTHKGDNPLYEGTELEVFNHIRENGLRLPENLFIVGTVNMDDTTHQFSRKVIDRAFTIEMNGDKLPSMFEAEDTLVYPETAIPLNALKPEYVQASDALQSINISPFRELVIENVPTHLNNINEILKATPFKVSFRVQNELVLYLSTLINEHNPKSNDEVKSLIEEATLVILLEKILPRVQGDEKLLGDTLEDLKEHVETNFNVCKENATYKEVVEKLRQMDQRLKSTYFANFF